MRLAGTSRPQAATSCAAVGQAVAQARHGGLASGDPVGEHPGAVQQQVGRVPDVPGQDLPGLHAPGGPAP